MRQIKFRGKRPDNGAWQTGLLTNYSIAPACCFASIDCQKVDPATVGQFTGLLDKNGKDIYEGDVVNFIYCPQSLKQEITGVVGTDMYNNWCVLHKTAEHGYHIENAMKGKIIGSIHDNKELIKTN
jgi:uncharacterized phage protein (TIGR01671 family)